MSSANIYLQNNTDSVADLMLYHWSTSYGTVWVSGQNIPAGGKTNPLAVTWDHDTPGDFWYASIAVHGGSQSGMYVSISQDPLNPYLKECMLIHDYLDDSKDDDGSHPTFGVNCQTFDINLKSGGTSANMLRVGDYSVVWNVFVLMLENHSFDNIFAFSGITGITAATGSDYNSIGSTNYPVNDSATPTSLTTDPGHEFADIVNQLCGYPSTYNSPDYPKINMSGFAGTYANSTDESTGKPAAANIGDIMACFNTQSQLPNIYALANKYVICDHWFSSLPGPTWPNRFYVHGASSAYYNSDAVGLSNYQSLDDSPTPAQMKIWETYDGFAYENGSIFDALNNAQIPWMIYHDESGPADGSIPQVTSLKNLSVADVNVKSLYDVVVGGETIEHGMQYDLQNPYPYRYTFIEPNYGDTSGNTYQNGSSQHPMDDVSGGENLIANIFKWISQSPLWPNSLLIITYDEHGGFYDSVAPGSTSPPNSLDDPGANKFAFNVLGVRVPAVVVSPLIANQVDQTVYEHSSVPATIEKLFGLQPLTARDQAANDLTHLLPSGTGAVTDAVRAQSVPQLNAQRPTTPKPPMTQEELTARAAEPLPQKGNLLGFLAAARKADTELTSGTPGERAAIAARVQTIQTRGDAQNYITEVMAKVRAARVARAQAIKADLAKPDPKSAMKQEPPPQQSK